MFIFSSAWISINYFIVSWHLKNYVKTFKFGSSLNGYKKYINIAEMLTVNVRRREIENNFPNNRTKKMKILHLHVKYIVHRNV